MSSQRNYGIDLLRLVLMFMVCILHVLGQGGYSAIWLMVLYCIGVLAKKLNVFGKKKSTTLMTVWLFCLFISWFIYIKQGNPFYVNYISPTIVLSGLIMVILFSRIKLNSNMVTVVSRLSPYSFGIYLFQLSPVIWNRVLKGITAFVVNEPLVLGGLYVFLFALLIFISGLFVEVVRSEIDRRLKISALSQKIVCMLDRLSLLLFKVFD